MDERIKLLISSLKLNQYNFARSIGLTRGAISTWVLGRSKPGPITLMKIIKHYPQVSADWLLKGEGGVFGPDSEDHKYVMELESQIQLQKHEIILLEKLIDSKMNEIGTSRELISMQAEKIKHLEDG